jgi:hypothetical protein
MTTTKGRFWTRRKLVTILVLFVAFVVYVVLAGSVSKALSPRDLEAIATLNADTACARLGSFEREIRCIRFIQRTVQAKVPNRRCAGWGTNIEPMDFLERGYGCCYDRAQFMAKALEHYGIATRHVALHERRFGILSLAVPGGESHATTEVRTSKGWMGVDSNDPFLLLTRDGRPVTYAHLREFPHNAFADQPRTWRFFDRPVQVTYGLYSRHGGFHGVRLPAPEINYPEFFRYTVLGES